MRQTGPFAYTEGPDYQAVQLLYEGHDIAMVILLPVQGGFEAFERSLDARRLGAILEGLAQRQVTLTAPRFEFQSEFKLEAALAAMGMPLALRGIPHRSTTAQRVPTLSLRARPAAGGCRAVPPPSLIFLPQ